MNLELRRQVINVYKGEMLVPGQGFDLNLKILMWLPRAPRNGQTLSPWLRILSAQVA